MKTPEIKNEDISPAVGNVRAALILAIVAVFSCDCEASEAQYGIVRETDIANIVKCLEDKVSGAMKKSCNPEGVKKLFDLAKSKCGAGKAKKFTIERGCIFEGEFSPKEREGHIREAIKRTCKEGIRPVASGGCSVARR
ncbi:MAG: hypothetical protein GWP15_01515 [Nitrospirae bacterium]|nr:hypothetical protein [Nitrospirota bacterium]